MKRDFTETPCFRPSLNTHRTHNTQLKMSRCPLPPYHQRLCPPSPWQHPPWTRIVALRLPMSLRRHLASGLARAAFGPLVWGTEMAPIEKLGDGRSTGLEWPLLDCPTQQPNQRWCRRLRERFRGNATGRNAWERTFTRPFRRRDVGQKN